MKILADATLPMLAEWFLSPFSLTRYSKQDELPDLLMTHDILLCRSTLKVTADLLAGSQIKCVATASSGIDHIDSDYLKKNGICLFDAKGCNAVAVADYVVATLAFLSSNDLIIGNKAGVIGVGEVGSRVVPRLQAAGFDVICYDPPKAMLDKHYRYCSITELTRCDLLCVHANLHKTPPHPSANLIAADFLAQLKPHATIINAARGRIINEEALLASENPITYCTDVYQGEPAISTQLVEFATLCTPHIAGHSIEAKNAAVEQVSKKLHRHFGLPTPTTIASPIMAPVLSQPLRVHATNWHDDILSIYNPMDDTIILKAANNKKEAFLTQRQAHQNRHDFIDYDAEQLDQKTKRLLGH